MLGKRRQEGSVRVATTRFGFFFEILGILMVFLHLDLDRLENGRHEKERHLDKVFVSACKLQIDQAHEAVDRVSGKARF